MTKAIFTDLDGVIRHWDNQLLHTVEASYRLKGAINTEHMLIHENSKSCPLCA